MADFLTNIPEWKGGFAPVQGYGKVQDRTGEIVANAAANLIEGLGRGYAQAQGGNILGSSTTAVEAEQTAASFGEEVSKTAGMSNAQIQDLRDNALRKFGTNDKKLQALVDAGHITTLEANARRHTMLQENLSNPILAIFREDFLNASAPYTGGAGELAKQFFGAYQPTEEERVELQMQENIRTTTVAKKTSIEKLKQDYGFSDEQAEQYYTQVNKDAMDYANAEREFEMLKFGSQQAFNASQSVNNLFTTSVNGQILGMISQSGSLTPEQITGLKGTIQQEFTQARMRLQKFAQKMTTEDRNKAFADLEKEHKRMLDMVSDQSQLEALRMASETLKTKTDILNGQAIYNFTRHAPALVGAYSIAPEFGDFYIGVLSGDMGERYRRSTNPRFKAVYESLEGVNINAVANTAFSKVGSGTPLTRTEAATIGITLQEPGAASAFTKAAASEPDGTKKALQAVFNQEEMSLSMIADSDEWRMALSTKNGKELVSPIFNSTAKKIRGMQFGFNGVMPSSVKVEKEMQPENAAMGLPTYTYSVKTGGTKLDDNVKRELVQMYKILEDNPTLVKVLGKGSIDEVIAGAFSGGY